MDIAPTVQQHISFIETIKQASTLHGSVVGQRASPIFLKAKALFAHPGELCALQELLGVHVEHYVFLWGILI